MIKKEPITLVLSGGGANGAFQAGVWSVLRREYDLKAVFGVSAGALNALLIGQGREFRMKTIWLTEIDKLVKKRRIWRFAYGLARGTKGVYDTKKLRKLVRREIAAADYIVPTFVGFVDMRSGEYFVGAHTDPQFADFAIASSGIPIVFDQLPGALADGGLRNSTPLADAVRAGYNNILVITNRGKGLTSKDKLRGVIKIFGRTMEIVTDELAEGDLKICGLKNELSNHDSNSPHRQIDFDIIRPSERLGDALDFSLKHSFEAYNQGLRDAQYFLDSRIDKE